MSRESSTTKRGTRQWYKTRLLDQESRGEYEQVRQTAIAMENKHGHSWHSDYYKYMSSDALGHVDDAKNIAYHIVTQHNYPNVFDEPDLISQACVRMAELGELAEAKPIVEKLKDSILTGPASERIADMPAVLEPIGILESQIEAQINMKKAEQVFKAERKKAKKLKHARRNQLQSRGGESIEGARIEMAREEAEAEEEESIEGSTPQDEGQNCSRVVYATSKN